MREKSVLLFVLQLLTALTCLLEAGTAGGYPTRLIVTGLCLACAVTGKLLLRRLGQDRWATALAAACAAGCFFLGTEIMLPACALFILELADQLAGRIYAAQLTAAAAGLLWLLFPAGRAVTLLTVCVLAAALLALFFLYRLEESRRRLDEEREEAGRLRERLADNRQVMDTLQYTARLEERGRLTARIHDKIGHGVSGSIILLEAALLTMENKPAEARETVERAVENLRESVEDIRLSLREERPARSEVGLGEMEAALVRFSAAHPLRTSLATAGRLEDIPAGVWHCLLENLTEALTNTLKHTDATAFEVTVSAADKLVRAIFADNGRGGKEGPVDKGMGLENMEQRAALLDGRCFFVKQAHGFSIVQVFPLKEAGL